MSDPNFMALFEFRNRWRHLADKRQRELERYVLPALVTFESPKFAVEDDTVVTINCFAGPSDGNILLEETDVLNSNFLHVDYDPRWQDYEFDNSTGAFIVTGSSAKVGGDYTVVIQPRD